MKQESYEKTIKILEKYKLPLVKSKLTNSLTIAEKYAKKFGYPVVIKLISSKIVHKTDFGAVITNINNKEELQKEYENLTKKAKKKKIKLEGILIQKQEKGREVIIGAKEDPNFKKVILFGLGGIFVEVLKDVSFRIPPIQKEEALKMINEIKGIKILQGIRGEKPININKLATLISKVSKLIDENDIKELDLNPVLVNENDAIIVDARIIK